MTSRFERPGSFPVTEASGLMTVPWLSWVDRIHTGVLALYQSGPTASRPTSLLWIGRRFYDTDLNKPVWVSAVGPVVWRDASGAVA